MEKQIDILKENSHKVGQLNVFGNDLELCCLKPVTGAYRDGFCNTGNNDIGTHTVCAIVTDEFLLFSKKRGNDLVVMAGKEYGTGSSRDWAAKGTKLLGVKAVIAESFERIHRSNLIGMGILPLQFTNDVNRKNLNLIGSELISVLDVEKGINPSDEVTLEIKYVSGDIKKVKTLCRIDTKNELEYYKNGGILQYVLRNMI